MKSHSMVSKAKTGARAVVTPQQAVFKLKQRVILSLNKLTDRDTHQIAIEELEKIAEGLTPDGIAPFLSCIMDTDSEQKCTVRKECVRAMGTLARFHGTFLVPHIAKMVSSIVKRLKDSDSIVRDACVETAGVLATSVRSSGDGDGNEATFIAIVKPLFEALGEQNRYVQTGSVLCLARVIDEAPDPPASVLPQMLTRVVKLLKNPHFMAKPAVIELIRSIIQAGGASTEHALCTAVTSILETLRSTDWITRKAASVALAGIAVCGGPLLGSFKTSCIRSLENCRFDKVKPVRDTVMHALQCWKTLPGSGSPEPSEAGSSTKENRNGEYSDITSASDGGWRDISCRKASPVSVHSVTSTSTFKKRNPLTDRKACSNYVPNHHHPSSNDWHIEISLPKAQPVSSVNSHLKEFGGSCTALAFEKSEDTNKAHDVKYDYDPAEENVECSSMSDLVSGSFDTKHVNVDEGNSATLLGLGHRSSTEEVDPEGLRMRERTSLDSTVTDISSRCMHGCCLHEAGELAFIRKQLLEIETKQSNLLDLLQVFMGNSVDNLSTLQLKVHNLEHAVDKIAKNISKDGNYSNRASSKFMKNNQNVSSSPRLSTSTPRPSVESNYRQPSSSLNRKEVWGVNSSSRSRLSTSVKEGMELWRDPTLNIVRNNVVQKDSGRSAQNTTSSQTKGTGEVHSGSARNASAMQSKMEAKGAFWKQIKEFLHSGNMESAYAEVLCTGDDLCLLELMDRTGPVLERLSCETASIIVSILTTHFRNQRFMDSIVPWFLQVVDLSSAHEPGDLVMSSKTRMEFLYALRQATAMECIDRVDKIAIAECAAKLSELWDEAPYRWIGEKRAHIGGGAADTCEGCGEGRDGQSLCWKMVAARVSRGGKNLVPATGN